MYVWSVGGKKARGGDLEGGGVVIAKNVNTDSPF